MTRLALPLAGLLLLAGCTATGGNTGSQTSDVKTVADALSAADQAGTTFAMTLNVVATGGDIPKGGQQTFQTTAGGGVREGVTGMTYRIKKSQGGSDDFSMIIGRGRLFVRPAGGQTWRATPVEGTTALYPAVRLDLIRASVLLAKKVSSGSLGFQGGLTRKYAVTPATEQLEQFESLPIQAGQEQAFLKGASVEIDVFVGAQGGKLTRVEVHMKGTDQASNQTQTVTCVADFKSGKVPVIALPLAAQPVQAADLLTP